MKLLKERKGAGVRKSLKTAHRPAAQAPADRIDEWIEQARRLPRVRMDLIRRVRAEIEAGTYETPERIDAAIDRLLDELGDE